MKKPLQFILFLFLSATCVAAPPTITSFSPASAISGVTVTINGTNFTNLSSVTFGGTAAASVTYVSSTKLTAVVGAGSSGAIQVTTADGTGSSVSNFTYLLSTSGIITDFNGYWSATGAAPNSTVVDDSHNLLAFTYGGTTWSTGANNTILNNHSVTYSPGTFRAFPVAGINGMTGAVGSSSTYLALAKKVDGSATVANTPAVASMSVRSSLVDGINGLDLGTGVTNLPATAEMTFQIFNVNATTIEDNEPDIILTQIAQPVSGNDFFTFLDANGNPVGFPISQDMTALPKFGSYDLDLFYLSPNTSYNNATAYSSFNTNTNREIRVVAFCLKDFGLSAADAPNIKSLRISPSGNSDYAFIAYNANAINLPPNVSADDTRTNTTICSGGTANVAVVTTAVSGGTITYSWQQSTDGGTVWNAVSDGGNYSGAATSKLSVANAINGSKYKVTVTENGNPGAATSSIFTITVSSSSAPSSATIAGAASTCLNTPLQLSANVSGGANLFYQWQTKNGVVYTDINGATLNNYFPAVNQTGSVVYRVIVSSGSGCGGVTSADATVEVTGISSVVPNAVCSGSTVTLSATATSGSIDWYATDVSSSSLVTATSFTTPVLSASKTYYVSAAGCTSALRVPVTATVYPSSAGGVVAGSTTVIIGTNSASLLLNSNIGTVNKWQSSTDNFVANVADIANTSNQLTVMNLNQTTSYRAIVQSGSCAPALSAPATITVSSLLPVHNKLVKATPQRNGVMVEWTAYDQQLTDFFEIERSTDGISFTKIATVQPTNINDPLATYNYLDRDAVKGNNFYRIKEVFRLANYNYSIVAKAVMTDVIASISIYPNPVTNKNLQLQFNNKPAGKYGVRLINNMGQMVYQTILTHTSGVRQEVLQLPVSLPAGLYHVNVVGGESKDAVTVVVL